MERCIIIYIELNSALINFLLSVINRPTRLFNVLADILCGLAATSFQWWTTVCSRESQWNSHRLHLRLPAERNQQYNLRRRSHNYVLPIKTSLNSSNFITRLLYKNNCYHQAMRMLRLHGLSTDAIKQVWQGSSGSLPEPLSLSRILWSLEPNTRVNLWWGRRPSIQSSRQKFKAPVAHSSASYTWHSLWAQSPQAQPHSSHSFFHS